MHEYRDEKDFLPYIALSTFNSHLLELYTQGETSELSRAFAAIERLHLEGEPFVQEAATIGILDGIQNRLGDDSAAIKAFEGYLLPESAKWWEQLYLFWDGKIKYVGETINK